MRSATPLSVRCAIPLLLVMAMDAFAFSDDPIIARATLIKAAHVVELRTAIDFARSGNGLSAAAYTRNIAAGERVRATDIIEMRNALAPLRSARGLPPLSYAYPQLSALDTIHAVDIQELRDGLDCTAPVVGTPSVNSVHGVTIMKGDVVQLNVVATSNCYASSNLQYDWTVTRNGQNANVTGDGQAAASIIAADFHDVYSVTVTVSDTSGRSTVSPQVQFVVSGCGEAPPVILTSAQQAISGAIVRRPGSDSTEQLDITTTLGAADSTPTFVLDGVHYDLPFYLDAPVAEAVQLDSYAGSECSSFHFVDAQLLSFDPLSGTQTPVDASLFTKPAPQSVADHGTLPFTLRPAVAGLYLMKLAITFGNAGNAVLETRDISVGSRCGGNAPLAALAASGDPVVGSEIFLDASGTTDVDNTVLTLGESGEGSSSGCGLSQQLSYAWFVNTAPEGSTSTLAQTGMQTSFTPDLPGTYIIDVSVTDSTGRSSTSSQTFDVTAQ